MIAIHDPVNLVVSKLHGVKQRGSVYSAKCPAHDDRNASLAVKRGEDGRALVHCFAGCSLPEILAPLGIAERELFADASTPTAPKPKAKLKTVHATAEKAAAAFLWGLHKRPGVPQTYTHKEGYEYTDAEGNRVAVALRFESPDGPKEFGQITPERGGWVTSGPKNPPLYRLPDVLSTDGESFVFVCEGEKDANRVKAEGCIATTTIGGASKSLDSPKWRYTDLAPLAGRHVVLLPHNDEAGEAHMQTLADHLAGLGAMVRVLALPDLDRKGDAHDWLEAGHDGEELVRLAEAVPEWQPQPDKPDDDIEEDDDGEAIARKRRLTELGNAERMVDAHGSRLRFNTSTGKWMLWDARRWVADDSGAHVRFAKQATRQIDTEAAAERKKSAREAVAAWAKKSEKSAAISAMIQLAKTEPGIPVSAKEQDADPWLLNCLNGSLTLKGGAKLRPHDPSDNCTRITNAEYHAEAACPLWLAFLDRVMDGDQDRIDYLQRLVGYCLTGEIGSQVFPALYGPGANGKSVFADLLLWLFGDYAGIAPDSLLTTSANQEHPTEIAGLQGKRLVIATETEEGKKLRTGLVKKMTGESQLTGRFMRQDYFTFDRTHKTWLVTNHKPAVSESKDAIWRRMHLVPFDVTIPEAERDEHLLEKLRAEADGILAWAVRGCLAWQRDGLKPPKAVQDATSEYRSDSDVLADFLGDVAIVNGDEANTVSRSAIREKYVSWCKTIGERQPLSINGLYERLRDHPDITELYVTDAGRRTRAFKGIALHHAPEAVYSTGNGVSS